MGLSLLIVGANGLVGQGVLKAALQDESNDTIAVLTRRPMSGLPPRVQALTAPAFTPARLPVLPAVDACLYCAGALPIGMSEQAYREATVDATLAVARAYAQVKPDGRFIYVSGMGADAGSTLMPLRVKGQAEQALVTTGLRVTCVRPGIVQPVQDVTSPHAWRQWAYRLGGPMLSLSHKLLPDLFTTTHAVGRAMLGVARSELPPAVIDNAAINRLAR